MGLDMYAYVVNENDVIDSVTLKRSADSRELWYWRKHHDLHGWMERLYREKGGKEEFNCQYVELTMDDLDRLERDIKQFKLPSTVGFFFGNNPPSEESNEEDLEFIAACRNVLLANKFDRIFYTSWW